LIWASKTFCQALKIYDECVDWNNCSHKSFVCYYNFVKKTLIVFQKLIQKRCGCKKWNTSIMICKRLSPDIYFEKLLSTWYLYIRVISSKNTRFQTIKINFFLNALVIFLIEIYNCKITRIRANCSNSNFRADYDTCRAACPTSSFCTLVLLASGCDRCRTNHNERITRRIISFAVKCNA